MFQYKKFAFALNALLAGLLISAPARAVQTVYNDEAIYLADLATMGYTVASDGFEDDNIWGLLEPFATTTVPDVTSHGVTWTGLGGGVNLRHPEAKNGDWLLQSSPPGSPFDGFLATANEPLFGFGGWVRAGNAGSGGQNDVDAFLNGSAVSVDGFGAPTSNYVFWGIIDTAGITSIQFETEPVDPPEPGSGDPIDPSKTLYLDDFTFGFAAPPSLREPGTEWTNTAGGTYTTGGNWNGGAAPSASNNALFHLSSAAAYTVSLSQNETASQAVIVDDKVNLDLGGFQYDLTETNITRESLIVAERPGDTAELTVTNGTLSGVNVVVAHSTATTGHLTVGAGGNIIHSERMRVGSGGTGTLDINNGGVVTGGTGGFSFETAGVIGQLGGNGTINVTGSGSQWLLVSNAIEIGVGGASSGSLNITGGGTVSSGAITVAKMADNGLPSDTAGTGSILISGSGSTLTATGTITLALEGNAAMDITAGGQVTSPNGNIAASADADVLVEGPGSSWTMNIAGSSRGTLNVGVGDQIGNFASFPPPPLHTGTLTIQNGASVVAEETYIGKTRTGKGILTVTGAGSSWSSGLQFSGNTFIGHEGDGELNVLNGATVQTGQAFVGRFGLRDRLKGVANIDGAGSRWDTPSAIYVGFHNDPQIFFGAGTFFAEGNLNVTNGGVVDAGRLAIAERKTSKGVVSISGLGSTISAPSANLGNVSTNSNTFTYSSNAELNISGGGLLDLTGNLDIYHGTINLDQGTINATNLTMHGKLLTAGSNTSDTTGDTAVILAGTGQVNANVDNIGGIVAPGPTAGILNIAGNYTQHTNSGGGFEHNASLAIELGGTDNSDSLNLQFDQLVIDGLATLGGTLDVSLIDLGAGLFAPQLGDSFDILSTTSGLVGAFDTLNLPALSIGLQWQLNPGGNTLFLEVVSNLTADFDNDGDVNAADLAQWQGDFGQNGSSDSDFDNDSDGADFLAWQRQFVSPSVPGLASSQVVPEPSSLLLASCCAICLFLRKTREIS